MKAENQIEKMLYIALKTAYKAGEEIVKIYNGKFDVDFKKDRSPVTIADSRSHEVIISELKEFGIPIISEEGNLPDYELRERCKLFWLVDPLDGTKEFVSRNGEFTINIALIENGIPVMGVVYAPVPDELYFASEACGSYKLPAFSKIRSILNLQEIIALSIKLPIEQKKKFIIVASRSHMNPETIAYIEKLKKEKGGIVTISRGSSLKLCMIAEGAADIYPRFGRTMEWDVAAGHAVIIYSGKNVRGAATQQPLLYNKEDLANPHFIAS